MAIQTYNFPDQKHGTTFNGVQFELKINGVAKDLSNSVIRMEVDGTIYSTSAGELTFSDAVNGKFQFKKQIINLSPRTHSYVMRFIFDDEEKVYLSGTWKIT